MMRRIVDFGSAIGLLLLFAGCVSTSELDAIKVDVNQLKRDSFDLKRETSSIRQDLSSLKEHSAGAVKEDSFNAIKESQASLYSQLSEQSKDLQVLQGRFDENKFFIDKTLKDGSIERELLRTQINSLDARVKELSEKLAGAVETKPQPDQAPAGQKEDEKTSERREDSPIALYDSAYTSFKEKKFAEAREKFGAFIKKFPKDGLAGNAHFWTGESYYAEKDYENAILVYEALIKGFPRNEKIPGALLKQGLSFIELGDKKTAKVIFDKLIEKYPDSKEAEIAKKKAAAEKKPAEKKTPKKGPR